MPSPIAIDGCPSGSRRGPYALSEAAGRVLARARCARAAATAPITDQNKPREQRRNKDLS